MIIMNYQTEFFDNPKKPTLSRIEKLIAIAEKMGHDIQFSNGYSEPGYAGEKIALANWNERDGDKTMPRIEKILEKMGYEIEWGDEWTFCEDCGKIIRISGDSYEWKPYYWVGDGFILCGDCVKENPDEYIEYLDNNEKSCMTFNIDLTQFGYAKYGESYENGFHPGQNDNPKEIAKKLREEGIKHFIFVQDEASQFYIRSSVWVKREDEGEEE
jgi:uncharacterized protein YneR